VVYAPHASVRSVRAESWRRSRSVAQRLLNRYPENRRLGAWQKLPSELD